MNHWAKSVRPICKVSTTIELLDSEHTEYTAANLGKGSSWSKLLSMGNATLNSSESIDELLSYVHTTVAASLLTTSSLRQPSVSHYGPYFNWSVTEHYYSSKLVIADNNRSTDERALVDWQSLFKLTETTTEDHPRVVTTIAKEDPSAELIGSQPALVVSTLYHTHQSFEVTTSEVKTLDTL